MVGFRSSKDQVFRDKYGVIGLLMERELAQIDTTSGTMAAVPWHGKQRSPKPSVNGLQHIELEDQ